jgi:site-specific DNA-methyltransferase (adenine-specific)
MEELRIEYLPVDVLKPYSRNAKKHPDEQVEHIANSIREFGFRQPLVIDRDGVLVIGHGRLLAAKKLGLETVPCVRADDLTDEQVKALRLADNKTNESGWDFAALEEELNGLEAEFDMAEFGFTALAEEALPVPENLDAEEETDTKTVVRLVFPDFRTYKAHEQDIKDFANMIGASVTVGK